MKPALGKLRDFIARSWRFSFLRRLMEGSFFLGWLVSDNRVLAAGRDLTATSICCRTADKALEAVMRPLYRLGGRLAPVFEGSLLISRPFSALGILLMLAALALAAKSRGFFGYTAAGALFLAGTGMIRARDFSRLAKGSLVFSLLSWWNHTD